MNDGFDERERKEKGQIMRFQQQNTNLCTMRRMYRMAVTDFDLCCRWTVAAAICSDERHTTISMPTRTTTRTRGATFLNHPLLLL